jgi:hypothetical protein
MSAALVFLSLRAERSNLSTDTARMRDCFVASLLAMTPNESFVTFFER